MANTTITPTVGAVALAGVAATLLINAVPTIARHNDGFADVLWSGLNAGAVGLPFAPLAYRDGFFQAEGTFGSSGSVQIEGSNDGVNFHKLSPSAQTSAGFVGPLEDGERPKYFRPNCTAGDNTTNLTITARLG